MMTSGVLATRHMSEMHTELNIATRIDKIRKEFEIDRERIVAILRDNVGKHGCSSCFFGIP